MFQKELSVKCWTDSIVGPDINSEVYLSFWFTCVWMMFILALDDMISLIV